MLLKYPVRKLFLYYLSYLFWFTRTDWKKKTTNQFLQTGSSLILSHGAAAVILPWVITDAGQLAGRTYYHPMIIISVVLVTQQRSKIQLLIVEYNQD